jgi:hypothetical protein
MKFNVDFPMPDFMEIRSEIFQTKPDDRSTNKVLSLYISFMLFLQKNETTLNIH